MKYVAKGYQTEEELLNKLGFNPEVSVITGVEFNPEDRTVHYLVRSLVETDKTVKVADNQAVRRHKIENKINVNTYINSQDSEEVFSVIKNNLNKLGVK